MNAEKTATIKFILISIHLVLFMFGSVITPNILHKVLSEEIGLLNQRFYFFSLVLWLPLFLFSATIFVLVRFLNYFSQGNTDEVSQKSVFRDTLKELRKPSQKRTKKMALLFWTLLILSFLSIIASQLFLFFGITFLI